MMRRLPPWLWLVLSLVFGAVATFMAMGWLKGQSQKQAKKADDLAAVVVASRDIGAASSLGGDQVVVHRWPQANKPRGSFNTPEEVVGRVSAYPFMAGEPILEAKLAPKGVPAGLTALIPPEKRAMTVKVDEASGVAGFLNPDNRVDVVASFGDGSNKLEYVSKVVLQNLKVLGTGQKIETAPGGKPQVVPTVTLEVSPEEAEKLALAANEGHIRLILRGQKDQRLTQTTGIKTGILFEGLLGSQKTTAAGVPRQVAEIIRKVSRESVNF